MIDNTDCQFEKVHEVNKVFICHITDNGNKYALRLTNIMVFQIFSDGVKLAEFNCQNYPFEAESIKRIYLYIKKKGLFTP